jgi:Zn finger protein HypA/HybF involved in hydrogenase expression
LFVDDGPASLQPRRVHRALGWALQAALVSCVSISAGCDHLLLANPPDTSGVPDGGATVSEALDRDTHVGYFPIDDASHHSAQVCSDCHVDPDTFKTFTCQTCHAHAPDVALGRHTFITGFVNDSNACVSCHPTGNEAPISVHDHSAKYFPIETGDHASLACTDCHTDPTTSKPFTCVSCHDHAPDVAAMRHVSITGYEYLSSSCLSCHPSGGEATISVADHSAKYFAIDSGDHQPLACTDCHTDPSTSKTFVCITCHAQTSSAQQHTGNADYVWTNAGCYSCHPS